MPKPIKTATLIGATGLIGSRLLNLLQEDAHFPEIRVLSYRPVDFPHSGTQAHLIDFSDPDQFRSAIVGSDAVFCTVGTTQKKVGGDEQAYRKVDYDIPVNAARFCAETGCPRFLLVSSVGADSSAGSFYLKLKGEVEDAVKESGVPSISIFRPSILLGDRNESRPGETIGKVLMNAFSFLLPSRMKPIDAEDVAEAMLIAAKEGREGFHIYHYREMKKASKNKKSNHS
ncbi:MAG: NAD-dependent epimerase/dehydratase family protein [Balneolaceae bacterium]|nr:MAG: NAD-dependent epimerase/dehydratase family protein [Balneolaceae bacterium]